LHKKLGFFGVHFTLQHICNILPMMLAKVLYMGLQDPYHLGREGKNLVSLQRRRFSILMGWKIREDQPGIFSMGVWRNFLVLLLTHVYVFFIVTSLTLGKSFIFLLTCSHYKQMSLSTLQSSFLFISLSFTTTPMFVFIKPSSLFSSSKQNHSPYTCMFLQALWLVKCVFHLFDFFGFLSLFIHMQVPCSLKPCIIGC